MTSGGEAVSEVRGLSESGLREGWRVFSLVCQLGLALWLSRAFHIESPAFYLRILPLAVCGGIVNHLLPPHYRPAFFSALGIYGTLVVFGSGPGGWMVGLGLALIGLCHLPISFRWRVIVLFLVTAVLMLMRAGWIKTPWPGVIWPIFASMFMFRLGLYLYDLKHHGPMRPDLVLSYFFLLPNVVFLLFPIIDFHTYRRTYYDRKPLDIYEEGAQWILRGLTHLVLYRLIYSYVAISPAEVNSTAEMVRYLLGNYGLYLRVSGQFHVIVGVLHLFGFRLPETHRFFYLASSFSDFWRRMNIYWKDFMQKMVYLPAALGLKKRGETPMLIGATLCVLVASWFLRSYQWFWLIGTWLFSATDIVFWGILGTFLMVNSLLEQRRGRVRQLTAIAPPPRHGLREALQTAGMFGLMCVLWGFWTSPTFGDFKALLHALTFRRVDIAVVAITLIVVAFVAWVSRRLSLGTPSALAVRRWWQHPLLNAALPLGLLWAAGQPRLSGHIPAGVRDVALQARTIELNKYDAERLQRGYYEKIVGVNRFNGELWEVYARAEKKMPDPDVEPGAAFADREERPGVAKLREDALDRELGPNLSAISLGRALVSTNRWGMRDRDYAKVAPPGTRRIAVLGPSYAMGSGVNDDETFESLVESHLNEALGQSAVRRYELLNFSVYGYTLLQQLIILSNGRVEMFRPDVVMIVGNASDLIGGIRDNIWKQVKRQNDLPLALAKMVRDAGVEKGMVETEALRRLAPYDVEFARQMLGDIAKQIDRLHAQAIYVLIPIPAPRSGFASEREKRLLLSAAEAAGLIVIDMADVFAGHDYRKLIVSPEDPHPNKAGHRLIASRLYAELVKQPSVSEPDRKGVTTQVRAAAWKASARTELAHEVWNLKTRGGSLADLEHLPTEPGRMRVNIRASPKHVPWHVKLWAASYQITNGRRYVLSFQARSDAPRRIACAVGQNAERWGGLGLYANVDLTPNWNAFERPFLATSTESNARIFFDLGYSDAAVELSNVVLRDLENNRELVPRSVLSRRVR